MNVASTVMTSDSEVAKKQTAPVIHSQAENATMQVPLARSTVRPRRKVIKIKNRKVKNEGYQVKDDKVTISTVPKEEETTEAPRSADNDEEIKELTTVKEIKPQPLETERPIGLNRRLSMMR